MTPYLLLLLFVVSVAHLGRISNSSDTRHATIGVVSLALVAFAGMRSFHVGTDTGTYRHIFMRSGEWDFIFRNNEIGYNFLSWAVRSWTESFSVMLVAIAVIVVTCYIFTIIRTTRRYETAIYLFIALGSYTFFFNGARQGIAAAICFAALPFLLQRRVVPYTLTVVVAALFHQTALITLVLYPVASARINLRRLSVLAAATLVLVMSLPFFVSLAAQLLDDKFAVYAVEGEGGGGVLVSFLVCQGLILYLLKRVIRDHHGHYARLLNIYLAGLVPALASTLSSVNPSGLLRLHLYFSHVAMLMWPMIFLHLGNTSDRFPISLGFFIVTILFFVMTTTTFGKLTPYSLNPDIALW